MAMNDDDLPSAPATARNRESILAVLARVLPPSGTVLEVASGTGEHAVYMAARLPGLTWQPSDADPVAAEVIGRRVARAGAANLLAPLVLDAGARAWPLRHADALVCVNMIHIAAWAAAAGLMRGAGRVLSEGGVLYLYGPYSIGGRPTAPSNAAFDEQLRRQNPEWGVRDLDAVTAEAEVNGLALAETVAMPANNLSVVFRRTARGAS
jgi:SAM-dependent methyltransferase